MNTFKPSPYTRIGKQFVVIIAGMILLALLSNALFQFYKAREHAQANLDQQAESLADLLGQISIRPLLTYDNTTVNQLVEHASRQPNVIYNVFHDRKGNPISHYLNTDLPVIKQTLSQHPDPSSTFEVLSLRDDIIHYRFPVFSEGIQLATIYIGLDKQTLINTPLQNLFIHVSSSLIFGLIIGIGIYIGFLKKISGPIEQLSKSAKDIGRLKFDTHIEIDGRNELSELARNFNQMRLALKQAEQERVSNITLMEQMNATLERRVRERTNKLEKLNSQISYQAMHDPLTGLANRVLVIEKLNQSIEYAARNHKPLAVFIIDLNNFKEVNDTLGHPEGDLILQQVATRIPGALRHSDTIGRLGGDEFAVVLPDIDAEGAHEVAKKIVRTLKPGFELKSHIIDVHASIGIAVYPDHGQDQTALIRHADVAMYESKRNGHSICLYNAEFDNHTPWRLALMADLRQAIEDNRLELVYQPQMSLFDNKMYGVEVLVRWDHEIQGNISPDQFIFIAENSGLIHPLTRWVLDRALYQWRQWKDEGLEIDMSINISARNLGNPKLPERLHELFKQYDVTPERIKLEFTESAIMANPDTVLNLMNNPKLDGLRYSIDDFGTGYSSLSYLKKLPVNEVKIDKSFVHQMDISEDDASIVNSVIDLAHNLGHKVVAEGVETEKVLSMLKQRGCDSVQGFYLSRPVSASQIMMLFDPSCSLEAITCLPD